MTQPPVWVLVLNHREADAVLRLLGSLRKMRYGAMKVLVLDNDSGAGDLTRLEQVAEVMGTGGNLGYAGGNNVGIRLALEAGAEYVWILNPDVDPPRRALRRLVRTMEEEPRIGVLGARLLEGKADMSMIQSEGGRIVWEAGGRSELVNRGHRVARRDPAGVRDVDFVPGSALLVRSKVFEDAGLLPEEYFMYFEETEFSLRAAGEGWRVAVDTRVQIGHLSGRGVGLPSEVYLYYFVRNRLLFGLRHTEIPFDGLAEDVAPFIDSWRRRVGEVDESWLPRFEQLVRWALDDARAEKFGVREGVGR